MHELSVTQSILDIASRYGKEADAQKVTDIYIIIGGLSSIVDDSVQFYWDFISEDTICEGAQLHFQRIPAEMRCLDCSHEFIIQDVLTLCPQCGSHRARVIQGEEFRLDSIEIQKEE